MREPDDDFSAYVRARQDALVRFGYLLTGDRMAGEDLAQIGLAKLYLKWDTIRCGCSPPDRTFGRAPALSHH